MYFICMYVSDMYYYVYFSYLHVTGDSFGRPIHGQREISAYPSPSELNYWQAAEGIFIKPTEDLKIPRDEL